MAKMEAKLIDAQNDFGMSVLKTLAKESSENSLVVSPFSLLNALAIANVGSKGKTAEELASIFGTNVYSNVANYFKSINHSGTFEAANKVYLQEQFEVLSTFRNEISEYFGGDCFETVNFQNSGFVAKKINNFVLEKTHGKIEEVVNAEAIDGMKRNCMMIVNAVYFLARWEEQFNKKSTKQKPFYSKMREIQLPQMRKDGRDGHYYYYENETVQVLCLQYTENKASMFVVLPRERFGLDSLLESVDGKMLTKWFDSARLCPVKIQLPKFQTTSSHSNLVKALQSIGLESMFSPGKANFSGIVSAGDIYVSDVFQKAFIKVDEEGTEAAAASYSCERERSRSRSPPPVKVFIADHPFLYVLADKKGSFLFVGVFRGD